MSDGILNTGVVLKMSSTENGTYTELEDLQSVPDMGAKFEKIDVTTLKDKARRYKKGLKDYDDLVYEFLYSNTENSTYRLLKSLEESEQSAYFEQVFPDGTKFNFKAEVSLKINASKVGDPLKFTLTLIPNSVIDITDPENNEPEDPEP